MVTALLSLLLGRAIRKNLGMTGELTLTGRVLPIGGLKEKLIASRRSGLNVLIFPKENLRDYDELPDYLKKGDRLRIIATARKVSPAELAPALKILEAWGLEVVLGENIYAEQNQFAGSDEERTADLQEALDDPKCAAILCARGGYGTVRLIDSVSWEGFKNRPKWLIGYSDVSVLHNSLQNLSFTSLHAMMPLEFEKNSSESLRLLQDSLLGKPYTIKAAYHAFNRLGTVEGEIVGGNLSMLYSCLGSKTAVNTKGKILFIEDLDEYLYHVDRMMWNLRRNGYLDDIKALIIGTMSDMNDNTIPFGESAIDIIARHAQDFDFPVAFGLPIGHSSHHLPLVFGEKVTLEVNSDASTLNFNHGRKS
jgi:muramoyltetrapeptide carboxypeptidase